MKIHLVSSTEFMTSGTGVHSAFRSMIDLLKSKKDVEVVVNEEGRGDIFHSHSYGLYFFYKSLRYKGRRVHTVHTTPDTLKGSVVFAKLLQPFSNLYFKLAFNHADVCLAISPMVEKRLKSLGVKSKILRVNNPVELDKWRTTPELSADGRKMLGLKEDEFIVLGVGQLQQRKGVEDFIEIAKNHPHIKFVWVGGRPFGPLTEGYMRINQKIEKAPSNVLFAGSVGLEDMPKVYAAANVFLFPSYQENSPLAPIEAAAAGLPVIFRSLVEYDMLYESEFLKAGNNAAFSSLIEQLYQDEAFRAQAISMSVELTKQFDKDLIREQLVNIYSELYIKSQEVQPAFGNSWLSAFTPSKTRLSRVQNN